MLLYVDGINHTAKMHSEENITCGKDVNAYLATYLFMENEFKNGLLLSVVTAEVLSILSFVSDAFQLNSS